jgi:hypothetical protein
MDTAAPRYRDYTNERYACLAVIFRLFTCSRSALKLTKISCDIAATPVPGLQSGGVGQQQL